ncbi:aspartate carbamoyltransferase catalytic subunit [Sphingomonas sp. NSE70-1]|uniref:Aspartate carbamoyltransferase n=1 Tax=Sphingomonas caseinilyticus TaxID=2908205 RepID=A0ABT0RQV7_9SPHN|nr:aspartate carbamoyltransferase catalytic subunit [Sphingomonas caseinilyticus]MCL6697400.1 aspartate carbamoyltransferase catalytic subunit [Sphingomonas caseinilyticus]
MHLLSIDDLSDDQIATILDEGERWFSYNRQPRRNDHRLDGLTVVNAFFENSTRTLLSFEIAANRLGAQVVTMQVEHSSIKKGETLDDTARTLNAMRPDALVIRHRTSGAPASVAAIMDCPVINAGDGTGEHPTQALLDAATIRQHFGRVEGLKIAICGDLKHSRVARSNAKLLGRLGAELRFAAPPSLMPDDLPGGALDKAVEGADVVMMLRVQRERLEEELGDAPGEYFERFGLTEERFATAAPGAVIMHPGPINRGVEIDGSLADHPTRSLIVRQVEMGVAVRMACLDLLTAERLPR